VVGGAEQLGAGPGDFDLAVFLAGGEHRVQAGLLFVGEVLSSGTQVVPDPVQRVVLTAAVTEGVLLDAAADLVDGLSAKLDDVEGVQDGGGVGELVVDGVLAPVEGVQGGDLDPLAEAFPRALSQSL